MFIWHHLGATFFLVTFVLPLSLMNRSKYCLGVMLGWDMLGSLIAQNPFKPNGIPGETISGRTGTAAIEGTKRGLFFEKIVDWIMRHKGHCREAVRGDQSRAGAVLKDESRA